MIPWRLPNDLKFFKEVTMGQTIIWDVKRSKGWESLASRTSNYSFNEATIYEVPGAGRY